jgi:predicted nucleic acid-binding protein
LTRAADSSICIPALLEDHTDHAAAVSSLARADVTVAHVAIETYSVLTRLPPPLRLRGAEAAMLIGRRLPSTRIALDETAEVAARLAAAGLAGGATYDGLIAITAADHDAELLTLDKRASRTYERLGVPFELVV